MKKENPKLMGVSEVAEYMGVSKQAVSNWKVRGKLPAPVAELKASTIWLAADIESYKLRKK